MTDNLPTLPSFKEINESNKKNGWLKTTLTYLQWAFPYAFLTIIAIIGNNRLGSIEEKLISIENTNTLTSNPQTSVIQGNNNVLGLETETDAPVTKDENGFVKENWITTGFEIDNEGYYCHTKKTFDYWSIWTRQTYPPILNKVYIKLALKQQKNYENTPTIAITYGEYIANQSFIPFYRLNIFDTDLKTIRLYNSKNDSKAQDWLEVEPDIKSEMAIMLSPSSSNRSSRIISLNPSITYVNIDSTEPIIFKSKKEFNVELPTVGIDDGSVKKQFAIGSPVGTCFKVIDFQVE